MLESRIEARISFSRGPDSLLLISPLPGGCRSSEALLWQPEKEWAGGGGGGGGWGLQITHQKKCDDLLKEASCSHRKMNSLQEANIQTQHGRHRS